MIKSDLVRRILATESLSSDELFSLKGRIYTFLNPVSYLVALKNKNLFNPFDGLFSDGSILVAAIALVYQRRISRKSFDMTSLAPKLFTYADDNHRSVCVVASKQDMLELAIQKLSKEYCNIKWKKCRNGYFVNEEEMRVSAGKIVRENPDFLIVGMGTLKQEKFLLMCRDAGYKGIGFTCGGFIHQTATSCSEIYYYPQWVDKYNLRFLYRIYKEPYTLKRYAKALFLFPCKFILERFL